MALGSRASPLTALYDFITIIDKTSLLAFFIHAIVFLQSTVGTDYIFARLSRTSKKRK